MKLLDFLANPYKVFRAFNLLASGAFLALQFYYPWLFPLAFVGVVIIFFVVKLDG